MSYKTEVRICPGCGGSVGSGCAGPGAAELLAGRPANSNPPSACARAGEGRPAKPVAGEACGRPERERSPAAPKARGASEAGDGAWFREAEHTGPAGVAAPAAQAPLAPIPPSEDRHPDAGTGDDRHQQGIE